MHDFVVLSVFLVFVKHFALVDMEMDVVIIITVSIIKIIIIIQPVNNSTLKWNNC